MKTPKASAKIISGCGLLILSLVWLSCGSGMDSDFEGQELESPASGFDLSISDATAPNTRITSKPRVGTNSSTAKFSFTCSAGTCSYHCALDYGILEKCASPKTYKGLGEGPHNFSVQATASGKTDPTPAFYNWYVDITPPETNLDDSPLNPTINAVSRFAFSCNEGGSSIQCKLNSQDWKACSSPYYPAKWTPTSTVNAPNGRIGATAVWSGTEMIVWGGAKENMGTVYHNTGGRYDPITDSWTPTSTVNAPEARFRHTGIWTGSEMIVWGGNSYNGAVTTFYNTGGIYTPASNSWIATSTANAPDARYLHTAVWAGGDMIVWGGVRSNYTTVWTGGKYNLSGNSWTATTDTNAPSNRSDHTAIWTGTRMIVWGGYGAGDTSNPTGVYDPAANSWTLVSASNAPAQRGRHTAVWTGTEMIVWGGYDSNRLNTGGRFNPSTNSWVLLPQTNAPAPRELHSAVWTGEAMIVWGGFDTGAGVMNTGGIYDLDADSWVPTPLKEAPSKRDWHTGIWDNRRMIIWSGVSDDKNVKTGGILGLPIGTHTLKIRCKDPYGNLDPSPVSFTWEVSEI